MTDDTDDSLRVTVTRPAGWKAREGQLEHVRRSYENGNILALYDGLCLCRDAELPLPKWLVESLQEFMRESLIKGLRGRRGKGNKPIGKQFKARRSHIRVGMVFAIREVQKDRRNWGLLPEPILGKLLSGEITEFGSTVRDACEKAHEALRGTFAQAAADTIRDEYNSSKSDPRDYLTYRVYHETAVAFDLSLPNEGGISWLPDWLDDWITADPLQAKK